MIASEKVDCQLAQYTLACAAISLEGAHIEQNSLSERGQSQAPHGQRHTSRVGQQERTHKSDPPNHTKEDHSPRGTKHTSNERGNHEQTPL